MGKCSKVRFPKPRRNSLMTKAFSPQSAQLVPDSETGSDILDTGAVPLVLLGLDLKLLCVKCSTKLTIDARWQGRELNCPHCGTGAVVPQYLDSLGTTDAAGRAASAARIVAALSQLSEAEVAFLSEIDSSPPLAARAGAGGNG